MARAARPGRLSARPWTRLRNAVLRAQPRCVMCLARGRTVAAVEVDHIVPRHVDPTRAMDPTNLQPLCRPCHADKTREDVVGRKRALIERILAIPNRPPVTGAGGRPGSAVTGAGR